MPIMSGWRQQYDRMQRSFENFYRLRAGDEWASGEEALDAVIIFFQQAYSLKDWIKNDSQVPEPIRRSVEVGVNGSSVLTLCADLANGSKHLVLTSTRTGDLSTALTAQGVTVRPGTIGSRRKSDQARPHLWHLSVESQGQTHDTLDLAAKVIDAWDTWLKDARLLT